MFQHRLPFPHSQCVHVMMAIICHAWQSREESHCYAFTFISLFLRHISALFCVCTHTVHSCHLMLPWRCQDPWKQKNGMNIRNFISGGYLSHIYKHVKQAGVMVGLVLRYVFHPRPWSSDVTDGFEVLFFFSVKLTEAQGCATVT